MKQAFTLTELYAHRGCYSKEMVNYCVRGNNVVTIDFIINHSDMKLTEKAWFISNHTGLTPHEHDAIAHGCATLAARMYNMNYPTSDIFKALSNDDSIANVMKEAGNRNQQYAFAVYAACSRDPYDRIYSACRAIELAGDVWVDSMLEYFLRCSKV